MLKLMLNLLIVLAILVTSGVHADDLFAATRESPLALAMVSTGSDGAIDYDEMAQAGHHCWYEHPTIAKFETSENDIDNRRGAPFVAQDPMKASAVVAPLLEPPSV